ncbi:cAMP-dependent protein kinase regulatory subunit [Cordyceps fumosorosea ARSEF 2679]|uniref:cAMP-dependent protein kinase regulatory subunit n=1 Tax=Cordyceps fumosorosea (strain ARSEF 2679) TaxID=1081104 RepID=A0A167XCU7_CORFA|nr:cAMP-dependent protein kinase regulatory subunit [Cordyceps fumosorosea ARSEF 2679]OAA64817.1 cAMP-dependent protein kinase regulatory subunit [Cordyceps fumosorosea ARSEF 2679]
MPDIDPAALSRPSISVQTPLLSTKSLSNIGSAQKAKSSQIPVRIDLEPLYSELKSSIGAEHWQIYKEATTEFFIGSLNQNEYSQRIDAILVGQNGDKSHLHNQLMAAIYGNVTREMPDQGLAPWVSSNDKPAASASKAATGDATERRLKGDVMQLPARDRRRIKDLVHNESDVNENLSSFFLESRRKPTQDASSAAGGINNMNFDLEIRKRFAQPLAIESGEFPDVGLITGRMLPFCYEAGLPSGHVAEAPQLMSIATDAFIKEMLTQVFARTRSNGAGDSGSAGYGVGTQWIQTHSYKRQLHLEEEAAHRGEISRDKSGLLPVEARAAGEQGPLSMADVRVALEIADSSMSQFPIVTRQILCGYREGELENWNDHTWIKGYEPVHVEELANGYDLSAFCNGTDPMDIDMEIGWEGAEENDVDMLDGMLDSCLAVGS